MLYSCLYNLIQIWYNFSYMLENISYDLLLARRSYCSAGVYFVEILTTHLLLTKTL